MKKRITILGSTGSIGTQTLEVIQNDRDAFEIIGLSGNSNADLLISQIKTFNPKIVCIGDEKLVNKVQKECSQIKVLSGEKGLETLATEDENDIVVNALVGYAGLKPSLATLQNNKTLALANKESLVIGGSLMKKAQQRPNQIVPIDSEHSAIFQCLQGNELRDIEKILLTCSGGPFIHKSRKELENVSKKEALKHPNWNMGGRITIDSATLVNKAFEVIEAMHLFQVPRDKIEVIIHPQSKIHSLLQFTDGNILAQAGPPDMRMAISYALYYPKRATNSFPRLTMDNENWNFTKLTKNQFPCFDAVMNASIKGESCLAALNAADEIAVQLFLDGKIHFLDIERMLTSTVDEHISIKDPTLHDLETIDHKIRKKLSLHT